MRNLLCVAVFAIVSAVNAQEKDPPPGQPPQLWLAQAEASDGKLIIQISRQDYKAPRQAVPKEPMKWDKLRSVVIGQNAQAFGVDGKPLEPRYLVKALAEPKGVAVFVRQRIRGTADELADPAPFYLGMLREGTVVLVVFGADIYPLAP
jgi:hypothetical protein